MKERKQVILEQKYQPHKILQNKLFHNFEDVEEYTNEFVKKTNLGNYQPININKENCQESSQDLADLWNEAIQSQNLSQNQINSPLKLSASELQYCFGLQNAKSNTKIPIIQQNGNNTIQKSSSESSEFDNQQFLNLWQQAKQLQENQKNNNTILEQKEDKNTISQKNIEKFIYTFKSDSSFDCQQQEQDSSEKRILKQIKLEKSQENSIKLMYSIDYIVYNKRTFLISQMQERTYTYFGLKKQQSQRPRYILYSFQTNEDLLYCYCSKQYKKGYVFILPQSKQTIAAITLKKPITSQCCEKHQLKIYNSYEKQFQRTQTCFKSSDGYIENFCFCNTEVSIGIKPKSSNQRVISRCFLMNLNTNKGRLSTNMKINGILSSPYNCSLQQDKKSIFFLGLADENLKFVVKCGGPFSPLIAMATSVNRIQYINSFVA